MAPFVLKFKGNKSFSPLSQISDAETLTRTWKVCTKVASHLEQGQRLENLSWRLWFLQIALVQADNAKQKREFKKFSKGMSDKLDKDKGRAITELQAPNFKRTDSTDKVRLRVEEMANQRDSGPAGPGNPNGGKFANDPDAAAAHYMKNMQYTFAVDPRVKPLATTATPGDDGGLHPAPGNKGRAGAGMMGKMRVRPMHPPPVPQRALANAQNQAQTSKDTGGDTTMHAAPNKNNEHAMDVSDDHNNSHHMDEDHQRPLERVQEGNESEAHMQPYHQDDDFQFDTENIRNEHDLDVDGDADGAGHHTPTPQHLLLPSHHPSALPYPPPPPTLANAHALSNALTGSSGLFIPSSNNGSSSNSTTPRGASYSSTSSMNMNNNPHFNGGMNMGGYRSGQGQQNQQPNIIRFPTIFSSDFGPTSLLCALPTNSNPSSSFSFESTPSPGPTSSVNAGPGGYQSFSALGAGGDSNHGHTTTSSSVTTQGIYGPHGSMVMNMRGGNGGSGLSGIGVGMQNADTSFDFGVPRPTFEFPIEEILKGEGMDGTSASNGGSGSGITAWDANLGLLGESVFGLGGMGQWSVQPQEIHSPTESTSSKGMFPSVAGATASTPSRQNSLNSSAYGGNNNGANHDSMNQHQQQQQQQQQQGARNSLSPGSVNSSTSNSHGAHSSSNGAGNAVKSEGMYDTGTGATSSSSASASASVSQQMSGGATASGQVLGGSGGVGSVVPGNVGNTAPGGVKSECANCGATHTPLWRRGLNDELNCNACGLYCKLHKRARPKNLRTSHGDRAGNAWGAKAGDAELAGEPVQCHNCATMATPLWRKDDEGNTLCNACGLYLKLHGNRRPLSMKSDVIRKRSRHETEKRTSVSSIITVMTPANNLQNSRRNSPTPPPSAGSSSSGPEPFIEQTTGNSNVDPMAFPFGQEFGFDSDYMSGLGMGMGSDLTSYSSFGSYGFSDAHSSTTSSMGGGGNGLASPTSPTEMQHIVETTVMTGIENGGGHAAPNAKRRRMTLESTFSGSSLAHTSGGTNSAHSSPSGLGTKAHGNSPPYFALDSALNSANNGMNSSNNGNSSSHADQSGHMSPTRSTFGSNSPPQPAPTASGVTYDFYGYPIHPPMVPLHPPSLIHPHSLMWGDPPLQNTPTQQSSMNHARSHSQSNPRSPTHSRRQSHSHSRSNSHNITMPLYLYDGGASSRAYEGANASTPTANGYTSNNPTDEELASSGFDMFADHSTTMDDGRAHYGPIGGM